MSTVSVIIPNFNREKLVGETIQNMLCQSLPPYEVIVVDDGSTDGSVEVIRSFGCQVRLIRQDNRGPGAARNTGLAVATGEYIQFMDSDDLASRNKFECQVSDLERTQADIAYGPWTKVFIDNGVVTLEDHVLQTRPIPDSMSMLEWFLSDWSIILQACLFRREYLEQVKPFRKNLLGWEDTEFMVRLFALNPRIVFTPDCLTLYRLHNYQKLTESGATDLRRLQDRVSTYPEFWQIISNYSPSLKLKTRLEFGFSSWQLWNAMQAYSNFSKADIDTIAQLWNFYPAIAWIGFSFFKRVMIRWRWHRTGSRWIYPYQSRLPAEKELKLIADLGLVVQ
jgi:glycosyltransferase involved in cell wall biosynthesis